MTDRKPTIREAKERVREEMRRARRGLSEEDRARLAARVGEGVLGLRPLRDAGTILIFYSFGTEIETSGIAGALHERGHRLLLPYLEETGMEAAEVRVEDELVPTAYGPKEPVRRISVDPAEVEAVVAPGLAFDGRGHRLGYGGGHYDRYLHRLGGRALRVGIGYAFQLVEELPVEPGDEPLHLVVTDSGVFDVRS